MPNQRADRSHGLYATGMVVAAGALAITLVCLVGLASIETTGLRPLDSLTSIAQSNGTGV